MANEQKPIKVVGFEDQRNHERWYVSELPGHFGKRSKGAEANSDWGWSPKSEMAIELSVYWQRRFLVRCREMSNGRGFGVTTVEVS